MASRALELVGRGGCRPRLVCMLAATRLAHLRRLPARVKPRHRGLLAAALAQVQGLEPAEAPPPEIDRDIRFRQTAVSPLLLRYSAAQELCKCL